MTDQHYIHKFLSDDGVEVRVRREQPGDAQHLVDLFEHMGSNSRYQRFSKVLDRPDPLRIRQEAERLAQLQPPQDTAWLAFADLPDQSGAPVAGARYVYTAPGVVELAVAVRDDLQRQGIGSRLLNFVMQQARAEGIQKMMATFRSDNEAVWRMLRYSPFHVTWEHHGTEIEVAIHLQAGPPRRPAFHPN